MAASAESVLDLLSVRVAYWDRELRNRHASASYRRALGAVAARLHDTTLPELLGHLAFAAMAEHVDAVLAGQARDFTRTELTADGTTRAVHVELRPDLTAGPSAAVPGFVEQISDVTAHVESERERDQAVHLFRMAMEHAPIGKAVVTEDGRCVQVNRALCALTGYSEDELLTMRITEILHPDEVARSVDTLSRLQAGVVERDENETRYIRKDGSVVWVQRTATMVRGSDDARTYIIAQMQDVTRRKHAEAELARLVVTDPLTGLGNRLMLTRRLAELDGCGAGVGLVFIDLDGFKAVNDAHGHEVGDLLLVEVGSAITAVTRRGDVVCRVGGDEFVVIVAPIEHDVLEMVVQRLRAAVTGERRVTVSTANLCTGASIGFSHSAQGRTAHLLGDADRAMYREKTQRRSQRSRRNA